MLFTAGVKTIGASTQGRTLAILGLLLMGCMYVPASTALIPAHNLSTSPIIAWMILLYFVALAFALLAPPRWRWGSAVFVTLLLTSVAFACVTYYSRSENGEYNRPSFASFRWYDEGQGLSIEGNTEKWINEEVQAELLKTGIKGKLVRENTQGSPSSPEIMIVICKSLPPETKMLNYPKSGTVAYLFDGITWRTLPTDAETYASYATLETLAYDSVNVMSMYSQTLVNGGTQSSLAFHWGDGK